LYILSSSAERDTIPPDVINHRPAIPVAARINDRPDVINHRAAIPAAARINEPAVRKR
jgi:hypothetical protein